MDGGGCGGEVEVKRNRGEWKKWEGDDWRKGGGAEGRKRRGGKGALQSGVLERGGTREEGRGLLERD